LTWADNSGNETGFQVERRRYAQEPYRRIAVLPANTQGYADTAASANTAYLYRVRACSADGNSPWSNELTVSTAATPAAPDSLVAVAVSPTQVNLTWADKSDNESTFRIERKIDTGAFQTLTVLSQNATSYNDIGLTPQKLYTYRVCAANPGGSSAWSNEASAYTYNPPAAPSGLTATAMSSSRIDLAWTDNADTESSFKIERRAGAAAFALIATVGTDVKSYSDQTGLAAGTTYTYRVCAANTGGDSAWSVEAAAATQGQAAMPRVVPTAGLVLHLDGRNPANTPAVWADSSPSANNAAMSGTVFTPGTGYAFSAVTTSVGIFAPIQPQTADKFAFAVRYTQGDPRTGQQAILSNAGQNWNSFYVDFGNNAVAWDAYNPATGGQALFRQPRLLNPVTMPPDENIVGVTWETTSGPGGQTGTARLYLNGQFVGEDLNATRPTTNYPIHSAFDRIGRREADISRFNGQITQVVIYKDYDGSPDDLMLAVSNSGSPPGLRGDFNGDDVVDIADVNLLYAVLGTNVPPTDAKFDLTGDGKVDIADARELVEVIIGTSMADTNLDHKVDILDLGNLANKYGLGGGFGDGDTDGSGSIDILDLGNMANDYGKDFPATP